MEIVIHGKPNAGSSKATSDINGLSHNLVQNFFEEMDKIREPEALVVDARKWKGTWYSIYTYLLGVNIKDTANRNSYFALSVVVPKAYYCLISEVYKQLKAVCATSVRGNYISENGKYMVQTLDDESLFEKIVSQVKTVFVNSNLEEDFDSKFVSQATVKNDVLYSINDCDSRAFVLSLKKCGRIIVTETEKSKDELLTKTKEYISLLNQAKADLSDKNKHIEKLNKSNAQLEKELSEANQSTKGKVQKLERDLASLSTEKEKLQKERDELNDLYNGIKGPISKVAEILGLSKSQNSPVGKNVREKINSQPKQIKGVGNGWYDFIPLLNTLLLMLILLLNFKGYTRSGEDESVKENITELQSEIDSLQQQITEIEPIIVSLGKITSATSEYDSNLDKDCKLTIYQDGRPISADSVNIDKPIMISVQKKQGYEFYFTNLNNEKEVSKAFTRGTSIKLLPVKKDDPIIISYRSSDRNKRHPNNTIKIINHK